MTDWLVVLPAEATPPGVGTVSVDANGLYMEGTADNDFGIRWTWPQVLQRLADDVQPLATSTDARLADLEQRMKGLTETLGGMALASTVHDHGERLNQLEQRARYN